jgi:hypothetical protein
MGRQRCAYDIVLRDFEGEEASLHLGNAERRAQRVIAPSTVETPPI